MIMIINKIENVDYAVTDETINHIISECSKLAQKEYKSGDHPKYSTIKNGQDTKKSPGELRTLVVTQTHVKDNQLKLMLKTLMSKW